MKKYIQYFVLIVAVGMVTGLAGCGQKNADTGSAVQQDPNGADRAAAARTAAQQAAAAHAAAPPTAPK